MGIRNDVFGLEQIYQLQIEGQWSTKGDVWNTPSPFTKEHPFGYFGGGNNPDLLSSVDRIDYSNDTATAVAKGPLSVARSELAATGNASFGYFSCGFYYTSIVDRIDYSNDTATAAVKGPLSVGRARVGAAGNSSFGYPVTEQCGSWNERVVDTSCGFSLVECGDSPLVNCVGWWTVWPVSGVVPWWTVCGISAT